MKLRFPFLLLLLFLLDVEAREPQQSPPVRSTSEKKIVRARDLGVPFDGTPGQLNAITDVVGVEVGYTTIIRGEGKLVVGKGPVRTGVTAVIPRGHDSLNDPVYAAVFSLNGNGEMTGTHWVEESGFLEGPVVITNTHSVGVARDAVIVWRIKHGAADASGYWWSLPLVAETWDGWLNDTNGFHVKPEDIFHALDSAHDGAIEEGSVGGGTGMLGYGWKGGIGTASRKLDRKSGGYTLGALVQLNCGRPNELMIAGVPVGKELRPGRDPFSTQELGSIIIVAATDAPLMPHQLKRIARRLTMGLARTGSVSGNGSGDLFVAFSTANPASAKRSDVQTVKMLRNSRMDPLFTATVQATEEAIVNALVAARTMVGINGYRVEAIPHAHLAEVMRKYGR